MEKEREKKEKTREVTVWPLHDGFFLFFGPALPFFFLCLFGVFPSRLALLLVM